MATQKIILLARPKTKIPAWWPCNDEKLDWVTVIPTGGFVKGIDYSHAFSIKKIMIIKWEWREQFETRQWEFKRLYTGSHDTKNKTQKSKSARNTRTTPYSRYARSG